VSTTFIRRNHVSIWNWNHEINQEDILKKSEASEFIIDETLIKAGNEYVWLWIAEDSCGIRLRTNH
jgi:transposase-like protein